MYRSSLVGFDEDGYLMSRSSHDGVLSGDERYKITKETARGIMATDLLGEIFMVNPVKPTA